MADRQITTWQLPRVLLGLVPETAPLIAEKAVKALDACREPVIDEEVLAKIGADLRGEFSPYSLVAWIFLPVFEAALDAEPPNVDLIRRCCDFVEQALSAEEYAAEGVDLMVIENFGVEHTNRVLPFAGARIPRRVACLRLGRLSALSPSLRSRSTDCLVGREQPSSDLSVRRSAGMRRYPRVTASTRG